MVVGPYLVLGVAMVAGFWATNHEASARREQAVHERNDRIAAVAKATCESENDLRAQIRQALADSIAQRHLAPAQAARDMSFVNSEFADHDCNRLRPGAQP